jgi:hypothetical protein
VSHCRWFAASRTEATSRVRVVTPGSQHAALAQPPGRRVEQRLGSRDTPHRQRLFIRQNSTAPRTSRHWIGGKAVAGGTEIIDVVNLATGEVIAAGRLRDFTSPDPSSGPM